MLSLTPFTLLRVVGVLALGGLAGLNVGLELRAVRQPGAVGVDRFPLPGVVGLLAAAVLDRPDRPDAGDTGSRAVVQLEADEVSSLAPGFLRLSPTRLVDGGLPGRRCGALIAVSPHGHHHGHDAHSNHCRGPDAPPQTAATRPLLLRRPSRRHPLSRRGRSIAPALPPRPSRRRSGSPVRLTRSHDCLLRSCCRHARNPAGISRTKLGHSGDGGPAQRPPTSRLSDPLHL